jgi:hypothetical protein
MLSVSKTQMVIYSDYKGVGFPKMLISAYNEDICMIVQELLGINLE